MSFGGVVLVGAGPGDPELLTVRAHRLLTSASIVAYDELVSPAILALVPASAERIAVGRRGGERPHAPAIDPRVVARARAGYDVVRLKGGDPMIFGRGGEEGAALAALGIPFEIVPGVSAALGAAASTGIPLTHRDASSSVTFVTAHLRAQAPGGGAAETRREQTETAGGIAARVPREGTIVIYMGLGHLREVAEELVRAGRSPTTPAAVIAHATLPTERTVVADLATIAEAAAQAALEAPALVIVGDVVGRKVSPAARRELPRAVVTAVRARAREERAAMPRLLRPSRAV